MNLETYVYVTKPVEITAIEFKGTKESYTMIKAAYSTLKARFDQGNMYISTLEGEMKGSKGDFIIKGTEGEFYPCKPVPFHKKYGKK